MKLQLQDGTPLTDAKEPLVIKHSSGYSEDGKSVNYTIPPTGIVDVDIYPSEDTDSIRIQVSRL